MGKLGSVAVMLLGGFLIILFGPLTLYVLNAANFDDLPHTSGFEFERMLHTSPVAVSMLALMFGGVPTAAGALLLVHGLRLRRL